MRRAQIGLVRILKEIHRATGLLVDVVQSADVDGRKLWIIFIRNEKAEAEAVTGENPQSPLVFILRPYPASRQRKVPQISDPGLKQPRADNAVEVAVWRLEKAKCTV
jgi:hypothetical protein